jgi:hypothetical protein
MGYSLRFKEGARKNENPEFGNRGQRICGMGCEYGIAYDKGLSDTKDQCISVVKCGNVVNSLIPVVSLITSK